MARSELERITDDKIAHGGVLVRMFLDMQNTEREKLQPLMLDLVNERLLKEHGVVYCYGQIEEPLERDGVFTASATITLLAEGYAPLLRIAFNYAPAGIEILRPAGNMQFSTAELQSMLMDISQISVAYATYILERVLKPEDASRIIKDLEERAASGRRHMENAKRGPHD